MIYRYPKIIKSKVFFDKRGYLQEIYKRKNFKDNFKFAIFVSSKKNVFRGLHFQKKLQQEKIVVVVKGSIIDFCVDLRSKSKNFSKIFKYILKENSILHIPKGFAHGYLGLKKENKIVYFLSNYRSKRNETGINFNDKKIKLKMNAKNLIISKKDKANISIDKFIKTIKSL